MQKSIGDNMFPRLGSRTRLALIKKAGFDGVELWLGGSPWLQVGTSDADVNELRAASEDAGLVVSNVANTLDWDRSIVVPRPALPQTGVAPRRAPDRDRPAPRHRRHPGRGGHVTDETPYQEVYGRTIEGVKTLAAKAAPARVKIGCENCCAEQRFLMTPREFKQFLDEVGSPWGDSSRRRQIHETGFPEQWIEIHGPRITRVHLKDVMRHRGRCGDESVYTNLFLGDNNWPAIRAALQKVRYDGWLIAEMESRYRFAPDQQFYDTAADDRSSPGRLYVDLFGGSSSPSPRQQPPHPARTTTRITGSRWYRWRSPPRRRRQSARIGEGLSACARDVRKTGCCRERVVCCDGRTPRHDCDYRNVRHVE